MCAPVVFSLETGSRLLINCRQTHQAHESAGRMAKLKWTTLCADSRKMPLPDNSVHCVVTSPPYFNLRVYDGVDLSIWDGQPDCQHEWDDRSYQRRTVDPGGPKQATNAGSIGRDVPVMSFFCTKCGAWKGCLGLEPNVELYISHLCQIFNDVKRVLHQSGTLWLNIGDSYAGSGGSGGDFKDGKGGDVYGRQYRRYGQDLKPKDLIGVPWRLAFALQQAGWWLRSDIIWHKLNSMPASVKDRPVTNHEYVFLLSKSQHYFYDWVAVMEPAAGAKGNEKRACRTIWQVSTQSYKGRHYATYPIKLAETCLLAGTSPKGCCPKCLSPWSRVVEPGFTAHDGKTRCGYAEGMAAHSLSLLRQAAREAGFGDHLPNVKTIAWEKTCKCDYQSPIPCVVLDPFGGSGTTGLAALKRGRNFIGVDISPAYLQVAVERLHESTAECGIAAMSEKENRPDLINYVITKQDNLFIDDD